MSFCRLYSINKSLHDKINFSIGLKNKKKKKMRNLFYDLDMVMFSRLTFG